MANVFTQIEFPSSLHVQVEDATSERSAVQLSRNYATRHYGKPVGHWVSGGGGSKDGKIYYTYVYSNPDYRDRKPSRKNFSRKHYPHLNSRQRRALFLAA